MKYLSVEDVKRLCELSIEAWNLGDFGVHDLGLLESAIQSTAQEAFGVKPFNTLEEIAAAYWFKIASNHPFVQGNKRTGFLAAESFLFMNGYELLNDNNEAINFGMRIMSKEIPDPYALAALIKIRKLKTDD